MKEINNIKKLAFFRNAKIGDKQLVTNDFGYYHLFNNNEYEFFLKGTLLKTSSTYKELTRKGFIKDSMDIADLINRYRTKNYFLKQGPSLHVVIVTLTCNHSCLYCHASATKQSDKSFDMSIGLARKVVDAVFASSSKSIAIEFQGGEPLMNWETVKFIIEYGREREKIDNKNLNLLLVSNFSLMTEDKLQYLLKNKVNLSTSLDSPAKIHNKNRAGFNGDSHKTAIKWLKRANEVYGKKLKSKKPGSIITITRNTFPYFKEMVDEYVKLGMPAIYLRTLNPYGFAKKTWDKIGYSPEEFFEFYKKTLDYIIELNLKGEKIRDFLATIFLVKILTDTDLNHSEYRSPCGAGTGQVAYDYNGDVYTCDDGRMLARSGDFSFRLGNIVEDEYSNIMESDIIKSCAVASCLDSIPGCNQCAFKPYCGTCPVFNYADQGNIFGQMATNDRCKLNKMILNYLFDLIQNKKIEKIFNNWVNK